MLKNIALWTIFRQYGKLPTEKKIAKIGARLENAKVKLQHDLHKGNMSVCLSIYLFSFRNAEKLLN
jgi:hypothetical protein